MVMHDLITLINQLLAESVRRSHKHAPTSFPAGFQSDLPPALTVSEPLAAEIVILSYINP